MAEQSHRPQAGRSFARFGLVALASLFAAGCQLIPQSQPRPVPPPVEQPRQPPVEQPDPTPQPEPQPGLPRDEDRHRVAVLVPLTGDNAGIGRSLANAANLALLDTGGERIRITLYDTGPGAAAAANQALADGNRLFLGPLLSENAQAVAPIARRAGVPVIAFSNDIAVAGDGVYVMGFNPRQSIERAVTFARSRGMERFGALVPSGTYGRRAGQAMIEAVEGAGGRMIGMQTYDRSEAGLARAARRLDEQGDYDAVLIADGARIAVQAAPLARQAGGDPRILGTELWAAESNVGEHRALHGAWFAAASDTLYEQFRSRYRERYGTNPYRLSSLGYDAVLLALRVAADWPTGQPFPAAVLRDSQGFVGVDGAFRFGRDGIADRSLAVHAVTAEGTEIVSPAPRGFD